MRTRAAKPLAAARGLLAVAAALILPASTTPTSAATPGASIDSKRELFITDVGVVDDPVRSAPGGAWHFGTLMRNIAGNARPENFVAHWLDTVIQPQSVNGVTVFHPGKSNAFKAFKNDWLEESGGQDLDLDRAPFRLCAIVNRPDLLKVDDRGFHQYGEVRFIYGAFDPDDPAHVFALFVIFEFGIPAQSCADLLDWAGRWHALSGFAPGTRKYGFALQAITDACARPDPASERPNHSHLNQLRTNEFDLPGGADLDWNLREWNLDPSVDPDAAMLVSVTTKQTPHRPYVQTAANRQILREYLDQNRAAILAGTHVVPGSFETSQWGPRSFATGNAMNDCHHPKPWGNPPCAATGIRWWAPGYDGLSGTTAEDAEVRHKFALQTCSGCHQQETGTGFSMVSNRIPGQESVLSGFLTGISAVPDPIFPGIKHSFNDLAFRAYVLNRMLGLDCSPPAGGPDPVKEMKRLQAAFGTRVH